MLSSALSTSPLASYPSSQRRRSCGGNGGARPRNAETAGGEYVFAPAIISRVYQVNTQFYRTAGELIRRTQHAPKLMAAGARASPLTPLGSSPKAPYLVGRGLNAPPKNPTPVQPFGLRPRLAPAMLTWF